MIALNCDYAIQNIKFWDEQNLKTVWKPHMGFNLQNKHAPRKYQVKPDIKSWSHESSTYIKDYVVIHDTLL